MARVAPPCLRHNTTSTFTKLSWEKARAKSLYHPSTPRPLSPAYDLATSPPTVKLATVKP
jgi:hypothetical protein